MVLYGGQVWTMDPPEKRASAIALYGGRILAIGNDDDVLRFVGPITRVVNLKGRAVTPGLIDSHAHLLGLGGAMVQVDLKGLNSPNEAAERVAAVVADKGPGEWIVGRGWDQTRWVPARFPDRKVLDAVSGSVPVALRRVDGHALWANSRAIALAGIDATTGDPPGGQILRDASGQPTGVFIDTAMDLIESKIPEPSDRELRERILRASDAALAAGITTIHEMGISERAAGVYRALADEGRLPIRVYGLLAGTPEIIKSLPGRVYEVDRDGTQQFVLRGIKLFADGALGSRGARLLAPYSDAADARGLWITSPEKLAEYAAITASAGWQLAVHAIGDAANRAVLDAYEAAIKTNPDADLRFRVEHAQVLAPEEIGRFGELSVIASMQPTHATSDMRWAEARVGPERVRGAYAWRSIRAAGGRIAAGSDFPVEDVEPLKGVYAAITRQNPAGQPKGGWFPEQRMSLAEALQAFTVEGAYAAFVERNRGKLRPGYVGDITVYDRPLEGNATLLETRIDMTVVGGFVAYERTKR